ncbi:LAQU0S08e00320g1_1 [Lachancea quebecensis]|uniref:Cytosolic Fe-S cluster assembly factor NAR1 n=1 Tax=Lachancea quebecensis TaxID=1654605 RepID=A0A0P1KT86_9SACH|nr:LAQU0S08e00320g1_1 [Lachancea quebecensis]
MSSLLSEKDLNDFISPGLACVKPAEPIKKSEQQEGDLEVGKESNDMEKVSISLQDCLACSGCITSSEEILLSRQSHTVFMAAWKSLSNDTALAVSIPPQCRLSLAHYYEMSLESFDKCFLRLMTENFGAKFIVGTQIGRNITVNQTNKALTERKSLETIKKPALCAVCPGFVLYAEKTKPELVPYLLDIKSPQQITGALLKKAIANIYHLTIMPCFDKKLEASRKDGEGEVDCVITPREFVTMLQEQNLKLADFLTSTDEMALKESCSPPGWDVNLHWASNEGSGSGGYAYQYILHQQALHPGSRILTLAGKNQDLKEFRLVDLSNDNVIASSSELYGFRNIQNLVRKLTNAGSTSRNVKILRKRASTNSKNGSSVESLAEPSKTDFIEVMACPGGCINGGGLLNGEENSSRRRALAKSLESEYDNTLPKVSCHGLSHDDSAYKYKFSAVEKPQDVLTVGNLW